LPRHVFQIAALPLGFGGDILSAHYNFESMRSRQAPDEFGIAFRFCSPEPVIEVHHGKRDSQVVTQALE
jgi:hypothetical protein